MDLRFRKRLTVVVCTVLLLGVAAGMAVLIWHVSQLLDHDTDQNSWKIGNLELNKDNLQLRISSLLTGFIGKNNLIGTSKEYLNEDTEIHLTWTDTTHLQISKSTKEHVDCYHFSWTTLSCANQVFRDCFDMTNAHWYGGYEDFNQHWPLETTTRGEDPFVVTDTYVEEIGQVQERYFLSTNGVGIFIEPDVPLYISINQTNDQQLCLVAKYDNSFPYGVNNGNFPFLKYHICQAGNVRKIHEFMSNEFWKKPIDIPDELLFRYPIWSTWAQFHKNVNQSLVLQYAEEILKNNFTHAQIEIDDDWSTKYGDMIFSPDKFENATEMIYKLNELGFRVTIWVHPFCNHDSNCFRDGLEKEYFVRQLDSTIAAPVAWWDGNFAGVLDVTNSDAVDWYLQKLQTLQMNYNISSFKFDAGGLKFLPKVYTLNQTQSSPNKYSELWARLAYESDKDIRHQEVRVGSRTQDLPIFVRMLDLFSVWNRENGLEKLIPCALTFGILGYPFVLPDMIGGNAYENKTPDKELFIRWLQANVFLPSLQFSIVPWDFHDEEIVTISRRYVELHANYSDIIIRLANESTRTGAPIVRPLWWVAPDDEYAQTIDSEFLLGDDILVAPVIQQGAIQRDIYLPTGTWRDMLNGTEIEGPLWLRNYTARLEDLPYFERVIPENR